MDAFQVGQDVTVIKKGHNSFTVGSVVTLDYHDPLQHAWRARDFTGLFGTVFEDEIEPLSDGVTNTSPVVHSASSTIPIPEQRPFIDRTAELTVTEKATNPKDAIGSTKLGLNLVPDTLTAYAALAFTEGATKYGAYNWRVAGVRASIYKAALQRHLSKWWNGEDADPVTRVPHLASVIACATIILDAELAGKLTDDRPPRVDLGKMIDNAEAIVKHLLELHRDKNPKHYTELNK